MALLSLVLLLACLGGTLSHRLQALRAAWAVEETGAEQIQGELLKTLPERGFFLGGYPIFRPPRERSLLFLQGALDSGAGNATCQQQLGGLLRALIAACVEKVPGGQVEKALNDMFFPGLKPKTCTESVEDIFLHGEDLVGAYRVPQEQMLNLKVPEATLPLVQSLHFLTWWLVPLAIAKKDALIWAGFWTNPQDPQGSESRTSRQKLSEFALRTEHDTVHPDTVLGTLVEKHGMLDHCSDTTGKELADNMWKLASFAFVSGMREKGQNTVIALVNKELEGERSLQKSVLFKYEVPTLGLAAWGLGYWSPTVLLIDLKGTCARTSPALRRQMFGALKPWYIDKKKEFWSASDFCTRSRLTWQCMDCPESNCELDERLARWVKGFQEAKVNQHKKDDELADATCIRRDDVVGRLLEEKADLRYQ
ncbi:unnamed protein product, partial [Symbiodinium microadriaticum]